MMTVGNKRREWWLGDSVLPCMHTRRLHGGVISMLRRPNFFRYTWVVVPVVADR